MTSLRAMLAQWRRIWTTSRRIDDRVRTPLSHRDPLVWAQDAVDAELSDQRCVPWERPGGRVSSEVLRTIHARRAARPPRHARHDGSLRRAVGLVVIVLGLAGSWSMLRSHPVPATEIETELPEGLDLMAGLAMAATPIMNGRMDEPLYREASALSADTARAASAFLDRLTIEGAGGADPAP